MKSNYLDFKLTKLKEEQVAYQVWNKRGLFLGWITYYPKWKKFVFSTNKLEVILDSVCLKDIAKFCDEMDNEQKV